jgi:hypothetical protein
MSRRYKTSEKRSDRPKNRPSPSDVDEVWLALARLRMFRKILDLIPPPPELREYETACGTDLWECSFLR